MNWLQWGRDHLIAEMALALIALVNHPKLQWGRDHLIAEMTRQAAMAKIVLALQWGRDHLIAEIQGRIWAANGHHSFNGAAIT